MAHKVTWSAPRDIPWPQPLTLRNIIGANRLTGQLQRGLIVIGRREEDIIDNNRAVGGISGTYIRLIIPESTRRLDVSGINIRERYGREKREYSELKLETGAYETNMTSVGVTGRDNEEKFERGCAMAHGMCRG